MDIQQMIFTIEECKQIDEDFASPEMAAFCRGYVSAIRSVQAKHPRLFESMQALLREVWGRDEFLSLKFLKEWPNVPKFFALALKEAE